MIDSNDLTTTQDVVCTFCGLLCDDLIVTTDADGVLKSCDNACALGRQGFEQACESIADTTCRLAGQPVDLDQACATAVTMMQSASAPVVGGMVTDVGGARAAVSFAEKTGAVIDHVGSSALLRNQRVMQRSGWFTTTLTEIRNRADLIVLVGDGITDRFPRLVERVLFPPQSIHDDRLKARRVATIGSQSFAEQVREQGHTTQDSAFHIPAAANELFGAVNQLRYALQREDADADPVNALAKAVNDSQYTVFIWSAGLLEDASGDLVIDALCQLINKRNETGRCAGFPIGGNDGDLSANQVCTWQTGFPLRTGFVDGKPVHDPVLYDTNTLIKENRLDTLMWISSLKVQTTAPATQVPTIVLGHPASADQQTADVFIPVETPGVGAGGLMVRTDTVVSLPLSSVRAARLPTVAQVLSQMMTIVNGETA